MSLFRKSRLSAVKWNFCVSLFWRHGLYFNWYISFISVHDTQQTSVINGLYPDSRQKPINQSIMSMVNKDVEGVKYYLLIVHWKACRSSRGDIWGLLRFYSCYVLSLSVTWNHTWKTCRFKRPFFYIFWKIYLIFFFWERVFKICVESTEQFGNGEKIATKARQSAKFAIATV